MEEAMPSVSTDSAEKIQDWGPVLERTSDLDGYTVGFVSFREDSDITDILAGLSSGKCICPHWGYLFAGEISAVYDTGARETIGAGNAFYLPAGHTSMKAAAGTEMLMFSPADLLAEVDAAIAAMMQARAGAHAHD
jgi:hypothetical protein